jgi:hypothetical protein
MKKWFIPKEMYGLPTKIHSADGLNFYTSYKEHIQTIRNSNGNSRYLNHLLNIGHAYGSTFILGWCILLRLYINEKIKPPLFATISYRVFIIHVSYYMFRLNISHLQVYHVYYN